MKTVWSLKTRYALSTLRLCLVVASVGIILGGLSAMSETLITLDSSLFSLKLNFFR